MDELAENMHANGLRIVRGGGVVLRFNVLRRFNQDALATFTNDLETFRVRFIQMFPEQLGVRVRLIKIKTFIKFVFARNPCSFPISVCSVTCRVKFVRWVLSRTRTLRRSSLQSKNPKTI